MLKPPKNLNRIVIYLDDDHYARLMVKANKRLVSENVMAKKILIDKLTRTEKL
jgi:hypothetical protein